MLSAGGTHQENAETTFDMKVRFADTWNESLQVKANNNEILTKQKYMALREDAKQAKAKEKKKKVLTIVVSENMMFLKLALKKDLLCQ